MRCGARVRAASVSVLILSAAGGAAASASESSTSRIGTRQGLNSMSGPILTGLPPETSKQTPAKIRKTW